MTPIQVKTLLAIKKVRQVDLARRWKVRTCTVSQLVNRKTVSKRLDKRLARVLGVTFEELRGE